MDVEEVTMDSEGLSSLEDKKPDTVDDEAGNVVSFVEQKFRRAKTEKFSEEQRMMKSYRNYRGEYGPDVQFTETEKSRVFIKITKTKTLAAYSQITDVVFGSDVFPIDIMPTILPEGIADTVHFSLNNGTAAVGPAQPENPLGELQPGDTRQSIMERTGPLKDKLQPVMDKLEEGPGTTPEQITFHPAEVSASKMKKKIHDQLEEAGARKKLRSSLFECCLFGTGIMKGPFGLDKEYPRWDDQGNYVPEMRLIPSVDYVSVWDFYPDPDSNNMAEADHCVQRHKMSRPELRKLKSRPHFRKTAIDEAISYGENYTPEWWETQFDQEDNTSQAPNRFEVLEFWGTVDVDLLEDHNFKVPSELSHEEELSVNIWVCNGKLLRLVMNPFKPSYLPYHAVPYEVNPYSFWGIGVGDNMEDTQLLMNGFMRMAVDNAALSGNLVFEVDENALTPGQDFKIFPGKVFRRQSGAPGQALFGTKFPNVSNENMQMFDKARQLADESTGLPSFASGQTGITGVGRTSSGISMLMGAASGSIRTVVKNIDEYLLSPLGKGMFHFNMQFDFDEDIKGDLEVKARGTESLMANEVRSQRLMQFLSLTQNPSDAAFARRDYILREIAKSLELDPDKTVNNMADAAIQAEIMAKLQQTMQPPEQNEVPGVDDTQGSGDGNIGTGSVPTPGEAGFSAAPQGASADMATQTRPV